MKTSSYKSWLHADSSIAASAIAAASLLTSVHATSIALTPASQNISAGGSFELSLRIAGLGDHTSPSLGAFDLNVDFDPALVHFASVSFGDPLLGDQLAPVTPSANGFLLSPGSLNLFSFSLDDPAELDSSQPAEFILATLHFTAHAPGSSSFALGNVLLGDANGDPLALDGTQDARVNIVPRSSVPEGSIGWVGALCLGGMLVGKSQLARRQTIPVS